MSWMLSCDKMNVLLIIALLGTSQLISSCEYTRTSGFFENAYDNIGQQGYNEATGADTDPAHGDTVTVTFDASFNVFSTTGATTLTLADNGQIFAHGPPVIGNTPALFLTTDLAFIASYWLSDTAAVGYQFTYRHIKRNTITSGLVTGGSLCALQRLGTIVDDCKRTNYNTVQIDEMLVVTHYWYTALLAEKVYAQSIIGVGDNGNTYVVFIYKDNTGATTLLGGSAIRGYINGDYASTSSPMWALVCSSVGTDTVHEESNCLCGSWNTGVYMFDVTAQSDSCTATSFGASECNPSIWSYDANPSCMEGVEPTDTCRVTCSELRSVLVGIHGEDTKYGPPLYDPDDVYCSIEDQTTSGSVITNFKIEVTFDDAQFQSYTFIDVGDLDGTKTITPIASCSGTLTSDMATHTLAFTSIGAGAVGCGVEWDTNAAAQRIKFAVMNYDADNSGLIQAGYRIIRGTCNFYELPKYLTQSFEAATYPSTVILTPTNRDVNLMVSIQQSFDGTFVAANAELPLGQDIFLVLCYEEGDRSPQENAEPYGVYGHTCVASKDAGFATTVSIIGADGCTVLTDSTHAFYVEREFEGNTNAGSTYEWCVSTGKLDATKWLDDTAHTIYFRCEVDYCWNQVLRDDATDSKCQDACDGNLDSARRRRSDHLTGNDTMTVETSVTFKRPDEPANQDRKCMDKTVAIATLVALLVILIPLVVLTFVLFFKLFVKDRH